MIRKCKCKDWKRDMPNIIGMSVMMQNHGMGYRGKIFEYCPWCGKKLIKVNK